MSEREIQPTGEWGNVRSQRKERRTARKKEWRWFEVGIESRVGRNCVNADILEL